ncbi:MAG: MMPL family transporter, partial [Bacteroidota bacterium]
ARFSGKLVDDGGQAVAAKNRALEAFFRQEIDARVLDYRVTGMATLIDKNNETLATGMMYGLLIAFGVIALIMGVLFRSFSIIIISLIPNVLPLLVIGGIMGFSGIDLKVATSIIFTIAFGIAVDDTIHYMSKLRLELAKGRTLPYAIKRTSISTGKAITVTSVILCAGFVTLILSTFTSTFYIGLLISITLLVAVLSDLILLPVLLLYFYKPKARHVAGIAKEKTAG